MRTFFENLLYDEERFKAGVVALARFCIAGLGYCFDTGLLQTGVANGGTVYGRALYVVALLITSRHSTPPRGIQ